MIVYNVTVNIDADVQERWIEWMKEVHIPDVMATGLFLGGVQLRTRGLAKEAGRAWWAAAAAAIWAIWPRGEK